MSLGFVETLTALLPDTRGQIHHVPHQLLFSLIIVPPAEFKCYSINCMLKLQKERVVPICLNTV